MTTLAETILAALPPNTCRTGSNKIEGKTATELYDSYDDIPWSERTPHQWLAQVAVTNPERARQALVEWLQDTGSRLADGETKDRIAALTYDAETALLDDAIAWVFARRKNGVKSPIDNAYMHTAIYLRDKANEPLFILGPGGSIMKHRVNNEALSSDEIKQETYAYLRTLVSYEDFNPEDLA